MSRGMKEYDFFNPDVDRKKIVVEPHEKKWIRCKEAVVRYSLSRPTVCKIACDCNALFKIDGTLLIDVKQMDDYIQSFMIPGGVLQN